MPPTTYFIAQENIYLRNTYSLYRDRDQDFWDGMKELISATLPSWKLVAAAADAPISPRRMVTVQGMFGMHIWKLPSWESLYQMMYILSEAPWYRKLGRSLATEQQELLIGFDEDPVLGAREPWEGDTPDKAASSGVYLYEEIVVNNTRTDLAIQRELNWFRSYVAKGYGWRRVWTGREITGHPGKLCLLWWAPSDAARSAGLAGAQATRRYAERYAPCVWECTRRALVPDFSEFLDQQHQR